jgi:hypothetical protein
MGPDGGVIDAGFVSICPATADDKVGEYPAHTYRYQIVHSPTAGDLVVRLGEDRTHRTGDSGTPTRAILS